MSKISKILIAIKFILLNCLIVSLYYSGNAYVFPEIIPESHIIESNNWYFEKSESFHKFQYTENLINGFTSGPLQLLKNYLKDAIEEELAQASFLKNKTLICVIFTNSTFDQLKSKDIIFPFHWFW